MLVGQRHGARAAEISYLQQQAGGTQYTGNGVLEASKSASSDPTPPTRPCHLQMMSCLLTLPKSLHQLAPMYSKVSLRGHSHSNLLTWGIVLEQRETLPPIQARPLTVVLAGTPWAHLKEMALN